ncbi:MAG: hypothetical protein ACP5D7_11645 [Limnospira sp.]
MMAKKSLADMVKQEAEKGIHPVPEAADADASAGTSTPSSSRGRVTKAELESQLAEVRSLLEQLQARESDWQTQVAELQGKLKGGAELETQIAELQSDLEESRRRETELQVEIKEFKCELKSASQSDRRLEKEVDGLKAELAEKERAIATLKEQVKASDLKQQLEEAQATALHLSETNTHLLEEIKQLQEENEDLRAESHPHYPKPHLVPRPDHATTQPLNNEDFSQSTWLL